MVTEEETYWSHDDYPSLSKRKYAVSDKEKFDATLFKVNPKKTDLMDPQLRMLLEVAYSAVLDAGVHPSTLRGSKTGVFTANNQATKFEASFLSNHISYALDLMGPSLTMDTGCSSSLYAILMAVNAIRLNQCDAALVCSVNVIMNVRKLITLKKMGVLSPDGQCRSFDSSCNGYAPAEALSVIFLQKRKDAKRIYADIVHVLGNNDGYKNGVGIAMPSGIVQSQLYSRLYDEAGMNPLDVSYIEGHITGTIVGDFQECLAIDTAFNQKRTIPLLVGSMKPNMGHGEASSGMCSIAKMIHTFETGIIPATINVKNLRTDIPSLVDGRLKVCTENTLLPGPLVAVNATGIGGSNCHILLRQWNKMKNHKLHDHQIPRLVIWSGRTKEAVSTIIEKVKSIPFDAEFYGLLQEIQKIQIPENIYRGFGVFEESGANQPPVCLSERIVVLEDVHRPVVWLFTGMGCQWNGMGRSLMKIRPFYESIQKCQNVLKKFTLDLISIITSDDPHIFDTVLSSCVGVTCIQIALVDVLKHIDTQVDYILGHSNGELVAAYGDGALTLEQTVLSAYFKGKLLTENHKIDGMMASIAMGYEQIKDRLPANVIVGCHNSASSCTITGLRSDVVEFIEKLKLEKVIVNEVNTSGIAFHSEYIGKMAPQLLEYFHNIMPERTLRSPKWISTSIGCDQWKSDLARYNSAEYHVNNFKCPVLFEEACSHLPKNAIIIEIAPQGLMQSIMKRSFMNAINVPLAQKDNPRNDAFFLEALGKLFSSGVCMQVDTLYPKIEFPVSRGTAMIAPLIKYDHDQNWSISNNNSRKNKSFERKIKIDISQKEYQYLTGHKIDDRCTMSSMTYCYFVWETLAMFSSQSNISDFNVEFRNIRFHTATLLSRDCPVQLSILIHMSGNFEVIDGGKLVVTGTIKHNSKQPPTSKLPAKASNLKTITLNRDEIYRELLLQGYKCSNAFGGLSSFCISNVGTIQWQSYWDAFMDAMVQTLHLTRNSREMHLTTAIHKITINAVEHSKWIASVENSEKRLCSVSYCKETNTITSGGIEISGVKMMAVDRRPPIDTEVLENYQFVPLMHNNHIYSLTDAVRICIQLAIEQSLPKYVSVSEVLGDNREPIIEHFRDVMLITPIVKGTFKLITNRNFQLDSIEIVKPKTMDHTKHTIAIWNTPNNDTTSIANNVSTQGFLIIVRNNQVTSKFEKPEGFTLVSSVQCSNLSLLLLHRHDSNIVPEYKVLSIDSEDLKFSWLKKIQDLHKTDAAVLLVERNKQSGLLGLWKTVRLERHIGRYTCVIIDDDDAPPFDVASPFYSSQLKLGLVLNILQNGQWGTYRHLTLEPTQCESMTLNSLCIQANPSDNSQSVQWVRSINTTSEDELIQVQYVGLSRRCVEQTIKQNSILGREFSGFDANGQQVMGMKIHDGALSTRIAPSSNDFVFNVPNSIALEEAASIPCAYLTIYAAFFIGNKIRDGQTILIYDGCNSMALAAIQIALAYGLDVHSIVSTLEDKEFLLHRYPALQEANIRVPEIETEKPKNFKVDVVLSFQSVDFQLEESIECLNEDGMMIAVEPVSIHTVDQSSAFIFKTIFLEKLVERPSIRKHLIEMINADLQRGVIIPLPLKTFRSNEFEAALRLMSTGEQNERIVIAMPNPSEVSELGVKPRFVLDSKSVYIIAGGLGGLGLELVNWMVLRGAKILILCSRRGVSSAYQQYRVRFWEAYGCKIISNTSDITSLDGCKQMMKEALSYGPVAGIFNLAGDPFGCILPNQTPELFQKCFGVKVTATKYLDELSRSLCPELEYFVVFSSTACGRGSAGQANYTMANSIMDTIAVNRARKNLPGKSIQFGPICDGGMLARMAHFDDTLNFIGMSQQRMDRWLYLFDDLLFSKTPIVAIMQVARKSNVEESNVFANVLQVFGVEDVSRLRASMTLTELGIDSFVVEEVKQILEQEINVILSNEEIKTLTIEGLKKITAK